MSGNVVGLLLPLPGKLIDRMLHGRNVYAGRRPDESDQLGAGDTVFFYDADKKGFLTAEAKISRVSFETVEQVRQYGPNLFLSEGELGEYLPDAGVENDPLIVLELGEVTEYTNPVKCPSSIPESGRCVTHGLLQEILNANG